MSGHNRWTKIKRKKEAMGASKGAIFTKGGGSMAASGAVAFQFERKGVVPVKKGASEDQVMELALDAGAEDVVGDGDGGFEVRTEPGSVIQVHKALEGKLPVGAPRIVYLPRSTVQVQGDTAEKVLRLVENLEDNDDVQQVYANFEISDEEMAAIESRAE